MNKQYSKDMWVGAAVFLLGVFTLIVALLMPRANSFILGAGFLPVCLSIVLIVLSIALFAQAARKGGKLISKEKKAAEDENGGGPSGAKTMTKWEALRSKDGFLTIFNMVLVAILVFVGVPYLGFFVSGGIFMLSIILTRAKKIKWYFAIITTAVSMAAIWAIFVKLFGLAIK